MKPLGMNPADQHRNRRKQLLPHEAYKQRTQKRLLASVGLVADFNNLAAKAKSRVVLRLRLDASIEVTYAFNDRFLSDAPYYENILSKSTINLIKSLAADRGRLISWNDVNTIFWLETSSVEVAQ